MTKAAMVVLSDVEVQSARVLTALEAAKEFKDAGDDVQLIFDGAGVRTAVAIAGSEHGLHRLYTLVEDKIAGLCRYCARGHGVYERAEELGLEFIAEYDQHPSLRNRVAEGFEILTF